jgi:transposase
VCNSNIHHSEKVRALVEDKACMCQIVTADNMLTCSLDCKLLFLPLYFLDLNLIEQAFSAIKSYLRCYDDNFTFSVINCACQNVLPESAWEYFRASGYVV